MCGIFGVVRYQGIDTSDREVFAELSAALLHRGPDGSGAIEDEQFLLGMHRLSIMDVNHGWQPFWSEDGQIGMLGNGEIYNAGDLRTGLHARGHEFRTRSDMEVVPHLFEEGGLDALSSLRGMFALVIVDRRRERIHLVRDRMGEKPLSYARTSTGLVFASEQRSLVTAGVVSGRLDPIGIPDYLMQGFVSEPWSLLDGVAKVPAGGVVTIDLRAESITVSSYWDLLDAVGDAEVVPAQLRDGIRDAVAACTIGDVPVGISLSGGMDSSLVASMATLARPDLHAFTVSYGGTRSDESNFARDYAAHLGIPITTVILDAGRVSRDYPSLSVARDEPIADIAGPSIDAVAAEAAASGIPILLNGLGGDELFWGYDWIRRLAAHLYVQLGGATGGAPLRTGLPAFSLASIRAWLDTHGGRGVERDVSRFLATDANTGLVPLAMFRFEGPYRSTAEGIASLCQGRTRVSRSLEYLPATASSVAPFYTRSMCSSYLRVNGLAQVDRLTMRHSVEGRTPLVDYRLAELVMSGRARGDGGLLQAPKSQLRAACKGQLPEVILERPKRGFTPPVRTWMREIWRTNAHQLLDSALGADGLVDIEAARRILRSPFERSGRISPVSFRLATLEFWYAGIVALRRSASGRS